MDIKITSPNQIDDNYIAAQPKTGQIISYLHESVLRLPSPAPGAVRINADLGSIPPMELRESAVEALKTLESQGVASAGLLRQSIEAYRELISCFYQSETRALWHKAETLNLFAMAILHKNEQALRLQNAEALLTADGEISLGTKGLLMECADNLDIALRKSNGQVVQDVDDSWEFNGMSDGDKAMEHFARALQCATRTQNN